MKLCDYCGKEISYFEQYCSDDCQAAANRFYERYEKFGKLFTAVNTVCVFGIPVGLFLMSFLKILGMSVASGSCGFLGLMLLFFPFPTEGMIKKFKISKAVKIVRIFGVAVMLLGLFIAGMLTFWM